MGGTTDAILRVANIAVGLLVGIGGFFQASTGEFSYIVVGLVTV
jgi:hypothetical protein